MQIRNSLYRVLTVVTLLALLLGSVPIARTAEPPSVPDGIAATAIPLRALSASLAPSVIQDAADVNAGWQEVGTGSASGGGISDNSGNSWVPSIAIAPDDTPYVAWYDYSGGDTEIYVRRWNAISWEEVGSGSASGGGISNSSSDSRVPSLAIAPDGTPYVAWNDWSAGDSEIYVRRWNESSWEEVGSGSASGGGISNNRDNSVAPSVAIAPNGTPYIAWNDWSEWSSAEDSEIYVLRWNGSSWEEVGSGSASSGGISDTDGNSMDPSIAIAPDGTSYVSWYEEDTFEPGGWDPEIYVRRWNGSSWEEVGSGSASGGGISDNGSQSSSPSIAVAPNGIPYIAWDDCSGSPTTEIYVRRWNGSSWEEVGSGSASGGGISNNSGHSSSPSIAIASDNTPYVAWHDQTGDTEIYVRRWNGSSWEEVGSGSASGGGISDNGDSSVGASVAITSDNTPYVAWGDNSSGGDSEIYVRRWGNGAPDTTPPAAITDLSASTGSTAGTINLSWTAPGDDGNTGTASTCIVRYSTVQITEANWGSSTDVTGEPTPGIAGSAESMTVGGLTPGQMYYFAIKTQDEVPNTSGISNSWGAVAGSGGLEVTILAPAEGANARAADTFLARASVDMDSAPAAGAQVKTTIPLGGPWALSGSLYDDGQHKDGNENDGIYAALLALPARITMPPGSYILNVTATLESGSATDSVGFNVIAGYSGVPTVTVTLDGPNAPGFIRNDQMTITATVTYPDASIHTDSGVTATLVLPDLTYAQVGLSNVSDDTWRGTYTLPQGGHYWVDLRVDPPASTDFIDGYGGTEVHVYEGDLALAAASFGGPYPIRGRVPLSLCVTPDGAPIEDATIRATVTGPSSYERTVGSFSEPSPGCYEAVFSPLVAGQHIVTYTATAYPYRPVTATLSFQVSTESSRLDDRVRYFGEDAVLNADLTMRYIKESAEEGQFFANEREADERKLVADAIVGITFLSIDAVGAVHAIAESHDAYLPASEIVLGKLTTSHAKEIFLHGLQETSAEVGLEAIANRLRKGPAAFYAAEGNAEDMLVKFENGHAISVTIQDNIAAQNGFQEHFVDVLQPVVEQAKSDITTNATNLAANLPPFTLAQEQTYIDDLDGRQEANWWLVPQAVDYERSLLHEAYERRTESHLFEHIAGLLLWTGAKFAATAICDGPCYIGVSAGKVLVDAIVNLENLSEDGRMMNLGADLMDMGFWEERRLWSNTMGGLDVISRSESPDTPQGQIETVDFRQSVIIADRGTRKLSSYADITIVNTGTVTARFFPIAYGENGDLSKKANTLVDPAAPNTSLASVELAPGASTTVRLVFFHRRLNSNVNDEPELGSGILINLFAQTDKGVYLIDNLYEESYHPELASGGSMSSGVQASIQYLSETKAIRAQTNGEPDGPVYDFPLLVNVGTDEGNPNYNVWVLAHNPFPGPMTVVLSQTVPGGVEVPGVTDGAVGDGEIRWYKIIQPHESVAVGYRFRPAAGNYGNDIALPPVNMSYYDAVNDAIVTLSTGAGQVAGKLPLFAKGVPPQQVSPDTQTSISIDVTNLDASQSHQGSLYLSLMDLNGTEVASANANVSLPAGGSQIYPLTFTPPSTEGTCILKVTLTQNSTTATVFTTFVQVRRHQIYLPLLLRNYTPGTGPTNHPPQR